MVSSGDKLDHWTKTSLVGDEEEGSHFQSNTEYGSMIG